MLGFLSHPNIKKGKDHMHMFTDKACKLLTIHIFSIIKGFLFFPYIITFFPIIFIIFRIFIFSMNSNKILCSVVSVMFFLSRLKFKKLFNAYQNKI